MAVDFDETHFDVTSLHHRRATHRWERTSVGDLLERMTWSFPDQDALIGRPGANPADAAQAHQVIAEAHEEAKAALTELRNLVRGLHPAVLEDRGLDAALSGVRSEEH